MRSDLVCSSKTLPVTSVEGAMNARTLNPRLAVLIPGARSNVFTWYLFTFSRSNSFPCLTVFLSDKLQAVLVGMVCMLGARWSQHDGVS